MCLILVAWRAHPDFPLVVAANRDEFHSRPSAPAAFWPEAPAILAGRDLQAGGTWLGVTRSGRFAALTNFRDPARLRRDAPSRGALVQRYLAGDAAPAAYLASLGCVAAHYNGFNLLVADGTMLGYFSNCGREPRRLDPGLYGLSNHLLDTPWPKVSRAKSSLAAALQALPESGPLFDMLLDDTPAPETELPRTGVSRDWERLLSSAFVRSPTYGTRSSTVIVLDPRGQLTFEERAFDAIGAPVAKRRFELDPRPFMPNA